MTDRGLFGTFDYDRDPDEWISRGGQWIYVGDE